VKKAKTYFEQIPVKVVKQIGQNLPEKIEEMGNDKGNRETPNGNTEPASRTGGVACRNGIGK
jgi:hypothetical protein